MYYNDLAYPFLTLYFYFTFRLCQFYQLSITKSPPGKNKSIQRTTMSSSGQSPDVEKGTSSGCYAHLTNDTVQSFSWDDVTVTVNDRATQQPRDILSNVNGIVDAGEMLALMGPRYNTFSSLLTSNN